MKNDKSAAPIASFPIPKSLAAKAKDGDKACIVVEGTVVKGDGEALTFQASKITPYDQYEKPVEKPAKETMEDDEVGEGAPVKPPPPPAGARGIRRGSKVPAGIAAITGYPEED